MTYAYVLAEYHVRRDRDGDEYEHDSAEQHVQDVGASFSSEGQHGMHSLEIQN